MSMLDKLIDRIVKASWERTRARLERERKQDSVASPLVEQNGPPPTHRIRQFTVHEALNGNYIEYMRRKYNPHSADEYVREVYIVQPGESLVDAISAVLVILEK